VKQCIYYTGGHILLRKTGLGHAITLLHVALQHAYAYQAWRQWTVIPHATHEVGWTHVWGKGIPMCRKSLCVWHQSDTINTTGQYIKHTATKGYALILTSYVFLHQTVVLYSMWRSHFKQQYETFSHTFCGRDCAVATTHGNIICWSLRTGLSTCILLYNRPHSV